MSYLSSIIVRRRPVRRDDDGLVENGQSFFNVATFGFLDSGGFKILGLPGNVG